MSRGVIYRDTSGEGIGFYNLIGIDQLGNIAVSNGARRRSVPFFEKITESGKGEGFACPVTGLIHEC